jgi:hypothetical protein
MPELDASEQAREIGFGSFSSTHYILTCLAFCMRTSKFLGFHIAHNPPEDVSLELKRRRVKKKLELLGNQLAEINIPLFHFS